MKSEEELQQKVYNVVMRRPAEDKYNALTMTLLDNTEIKVNSSPLLECIGVCQIPLNSVKKIQARLGAISEMYWEVFYLHSQTGAEMGIQADFADYSPRIYEMFQSSRLHFR